MKTKEDLILQEIGDESIIVPVGQEADRLHGVIKLNAAGLLLWKLLAQGEQTVEGLADAVVNRFAVDKDTAQKDVAQFIKTLHNLGCIEE